MAFYHRRRPLKSTLRGARPCLALTVVELPPRRALIYPRHQARIPYQTTPTLVEYFDVPCRDCPDCGARAIAMMPPGLKSQQTDGTNAVCHPGYGGCGSGGIVLFS